MKAMRNARAIGAPASWGRKEVALLSRPGLMVGDVITEQGSLTAIGMLGPPPNNRDQVEGLSS